MRCLICNKDIDGDFERCPECGSLLEQQSAFTSVLPVISEEDERKKFLEAIDAMEDDEVDLDDLPSLNNLVTDLKDDSDKKIGGVPFDTSEITKITDLDKTIEIDSLGGYSLCDTSSSLYGNLQTTNRNDIACKVEWIIETGDDNITIMAYNNKCGKVSKTVSLA